MQDGVYVVQFVSPFGDTGHGLVVIAAGSLKGGDSQSIYHGRIQLRGKRLTLRLQVSRREATAAPSGGTLAHFALELLGTMTESKDGFQVAGSLCGYPHYRLGMVGHKVRDLV